MHILPMHMAIYIYINHTALFILSYQELVTYTFIIDPSVFTYDSALSFLVICVQCYTGPCGVLVPTGTVHSNNEFEFAVEFIKLWCGVSLELKCTIILIILYM